MIRHIPCGPFVNASERLAVERLQAKLVGTDGRWLILSNLDHSAHPGGRADEIDVVIIGPPGVAVIEVKHWDADWLRKEAALVEQEAGRIDAKAKRVAGRLRAGLDPGFVPAKLLLTRGEVRFKGKRRPTPRGVPVFGLPEWRELLNLDGPRRLTDQQVELAARLLEPRIKVALHGELRQFAGLINLERVVLPGPPQTSAGAFHRVYRGRHPTRRDRVILHLYDLSVRDDKDALTHARREFETIQRWQKARFIPSLLDSFQEADGYPGELWFFSLVDPDAVSIEDRAGDSGWSLLDRLAYARAAVAALQRFHAPEPTDGPPTLHRQLSPQSLRVRHNNQPLFTDLNLTRIAEATTVAGVRDDPGDLGPWWAPEVRQGGFAVADTRSDVYGLCASLRLLFRGDDPLARQIDAALTTGCADDPAARVTLAHLTATLAAIAGSRPTAPLAAEPRALPAATYWDEDTVVPFKDARYKVLGRLGAGGVGQTFKVVELGDQDEECFGTYVGKVVNNATDGQAAIAAYRRARAWTTHPHLSPIHEYAADWEPDRFVALLKWIEGTPLSDYCGVLPILAEDLDEGSGDEAVEALLLRWAGQLCDALAALHRQGLVHGDVSPRNIIVSGADVLLTDYDTVVRTGESPRGGTLPYSSPAVQAREPIAPADDLYALAASLFEVLADRDPFTHGAERRKDLGLCWNGITGCTRLRPWLDRATAPAPGQRFQDAAAALAALPARVADAGAPPPPAVPPRTDNHNPWLSELLRGYPGSRHGVRETRGLDSDFARDTYVETGLDRALQGAIEAREVALVILFGNAGDGKTACLQRLIANLGGQVQSSRRVWETTLPDGRALVVNLDGAAAWQGRDANDLLDDLFAPFQDGAPPADRVHLLAVNNGKLLEWVETRPARTWLTDTMRRVLLFDEASPAPWLRLIDLNRRSLVGGLDEAQLRTDFLDELLDRLLGGAPASATGDIGADPWQPCVTCTAQDRCTAWGSVRRLQDPLTGPGLRGRLGDLLQACHQRGEVHITARELRAALTYSLFGLDDCADYHRQPDYTPEPLWQRLFDARSTQRQGDLLGELARFDPALESDPIADRRLLRASGGVADGAPHRLAAARRRAWLLEPTIGVGLAHGRHHARFRDLPRLPAGEREALRDDLLLGIARLEELPALAFTPARLAQGVPLRITPRTPTESAFWVTKPWARFTLEPALPSVAEGLARLHTHLHLTYHYTAGGTETLVLGLELFHLLLELKDGAQLSGVGEEAIFAQLDIFTTRLASEDARTLTGWHPSDERNLYEVRVEARAGRQVLVRKRLAA